MPAHHDRAALSGQQGRPCGQRQACPLDGPRDTICPLVGDNTDHLSGAGVFDFDHLARVGATPSAAHHFVQHEDGSRLRAVIEKQVDLRAVVHVFIRCHQGYASGQTAAGHASGQTTIGQTHPHKRLCMIANEIYKYTVR
ncbi:hypothetical protein Ga0080574_TMP814 [Salipiger abyssi]|uniref:Uncharacterized protein n=1 Tax=Salipiger abyssi TaxID=1250539 RepID=A0A1P8UP71_9RHOB|nr:hypothetical protein Ga0080574_TMP814 [Salipiger abyssi]